MFKLSIRSTVLSILGMLLLATSSASAVETFKTSFHGVGVQLWFEVEHFDERSPVDDDSVFELNDEPGAFGRSIIGHDPSPDGSGFIRYTFNISEAGGAGGTWYFWGRVINPGDRSSFMLVDGDPADAAEFPIELPTGNLGNERRVFEQPAGSPGNWEWSRADHAEGHTKTLQDGENSMYIFNRQDNNLWDVFMWTDDPDYEPTDVDYENATAPNPYIAFRPVPAHDANDVPYYSNVLSWNPGESAATHTLYFGTNFDDVNDRSATSLLAEGLTEAAQVIQTDLETTYYWAVDEVSGAPDFAVHAGKVWNFSVEDVANLITNITATADSQFGAAFGPENTVNGSGLIDGLHGVEGEDMWQSGSLPATIEFQFDAVYVLHEMRVWNHNRAVEAFLGSGAKDVTVEVSANGTDFTVLEGVEPFTQAPGANDYAANTTLALPGIEAKAVRLTITSNYGGAEFTGLSEVQFTAIPVYPREFSPANDVEIEGLNVTMMWRAGRYALEHRVLLSQDEAAVADGSAVIDTTAEKSHALSDLQYGKDYFNQIVDVAADGMTYAGPINVFHTPASGSIDDFESYNDIDPPDPESHTIFGSWSDGYLTPTTNGALVGHDPADPSYAETVIVHGGAQSMPFNFDNTTAPMSETTRVLDPTEDWIRTGATTLSLWAYAGDDNTGGTLTLKINGMQVALVDNGSTYPAGYTAWGWVQYLVDLATLDVSSVSSLTFGVNDPGAQGVFYVDDIRIYAEAPALDQMISSVGPVIEAESGAITAPFEVLSDRPEASGGSYINTDESVGNSSNAVPAPDDGWAVYTITIPADGNYLIAFRGAREESDGSDSFWVNIPGMVVNDTDLHSSGFVKCADIFSGGDGFVWDYVRDIDGDDTDPIVFTLTAGQHELQIARREDGTALDAIAIFSVN